MEVIAVLISAGMKTCGTLRSLGKESALISMGSEVNRLCRD